VNKDYHFLHIIPLLFVLFSYHGSINFFNVTTWRPQGLQGFSDGRDWTKLIITWREVGGMRNSQLPCGFESARRPLQLSVAAAEGAVPGRGGRPGPRRRRSACWLETGTTHHKSDVVPRSKVPVTSQLAAGWY